MVASAAHFLHEIINFGEISRTLNNLKARRVGSYSKQPNKLKVIFIISNKL